MENTTVLSQQPAPRKGRMKRQDNLWGWIFVAIPIVATIVFTLIPVIMTIAASFTNWTMLKPIFESKVMGIANYQKLFGDKTMWRTLGNTMIYMIGVPIGMVLSLLLAICMNRDIVGKNAFRVIYYIPVVASVVSISLLFQNLFDFDGLVNKLIVALGGKRVDWATPAYTKPLIIIMMTWKGLGGTILLFLAGLQGVNQTYYEAAKLDGAGTVKIFFKITMPQLTPVLFYVLVTSVIGGFQLFTEPFLFYGNSKNPFNEMTLVMYLYNQAFGTTVRGGYASAMAIFLAVLVFLATGIQFLVNKWRSKD